MSHNFKPGDKVIVEGFRHDCTEKRFIGIFVGYHPVNPKRAVVTNSWTDIVGVPIEDIKPYREPHKVEGWANVYKHGIPWIYPTREQADADAIKTRIACVYVSGTEGVEP